MPDAQPIAYYADGTPVPAESAAAEVAAGRAGYKRGTRIQVYNQGTNTFGSVDAEHLSTALAEGYAPLSADAATEKVLERDATTTGGQALAGLEAVGRGLTFGATTHLAAGFEADTDAMRARQEYNPGTALAGEIVGAAVPAVLSGGSGTVGSLARMTPAGQLAARTAKLGGTLERAMAGRSGAVLARGAGAAVEGGIEGAAEGLGAALSDATLQDVPLVGESLWASTGKGALFGVGLGASLGLGLGAAGKAKSKAADAIGKLDLPERGTIADGLKGLKDRSQAGVAAISARALGDKKGVIQQLLDPGDVGQRTRTNFLNADEAEETFVKSFSSRTDDMLAAEPVLRDAFAGEGKAKRIAATVRDAPDVLPTVERELDDILSNTESLSVINKLEVGDRRYASGAGKRAKRIHEWAKRAKANSTTGPAEAFMELDQLRRAVFDESDRADRVLAGGGADTDARRAAEQRKQVANDIGQRLRAFLEREDVWGTAAAQQSARNAAGREAFNLGGDFGARFEKRLKESESAENWQRKKRVGDRVKVQTFAKNLGDYRFEQELDSTLQALDARANLYRTMLDQGDIPEQHLATVQKAHESAVAGRAEVLEQVQRARDVAVLKEAEKLEQTSMLSSVTDNGALLGGLVGGVGGAAAGAAAKAVFQPSRLAKQIALMEHITSKPARIQKQLRGAVKGLVKDSRAAVEQRAGRRDSRLARRETKRKPVVSAAVAAFGKTTSARRKKFDRRRRQIEDFLGNPELAIAHAAHVIGPISGTAPRVAAEVVSQHMRAMKFLESKLPPRIPPSNTFQPQHYQRKATDQEIYRFARYAAAVDDPMSVLADLRNGHLTSEGVEAVKATAPRIYELMRSTVLEEFTSTPVKIPYPTVHRLSLLMDVAGHPTLEPAFVKRQQMRTQEAALAEDEAKPPAKGSGPETAKQSMTESERIAS